MKILLLRLSLAVALALLAPATQAADLIKGAPKGTVVKLKDGRTAWADADYVVITAEKKGEVGQHITVLMRPSDAAPKAQILLGLSPWMELKDTDANYFAGLVHKALLVVAQTGPDGTLKVYNLETKKQVFSDGFHEESARVIDDKFLEFEKLLEGNISSLPPAEAKANPAIRKWLSGGGSAGRFQKVRLDLATFQQRTIGTPVLHKMQ